MSCSGPEPAALLIPAALPFLLLSEFCGTFPSSGAEHSALISVPSHGYPVDGFMQQLRLEVAERPREATQEKPSKSFQHTRTTHQHFPPRPEICRCQCNVDHGFDRASLPSGHDFPAANTSTLACVNSSGIWIRFTDSCISLVRRWEYIWVTCMLEWPSSL